MILKTRNHFILCIMQKNLLLQIGDEKNKSFKIRKCLSSCCQSLLLQHPKQPPCQRLSTFSSCANKYCTSNSFFSSSTSFVCICVSNFWCQTSMDLCDITKHQQTKHNTNKHNQHKTNQIIFFKNKIIMQRKHMKLRHTTHTLFVPPLII